MNRCDWCTGSEMYIKYHDEEWGLPVYDDGKQFEFLVLESAQAGLSWSTILKKRENFKKAYSGFNPNKVAEFDEKDVERLLGDPGIIRNRKKIEASINNAQIFLKIQEQYGSFCNYIWGFTDGRPLVNRWKKLSQIPANTELSNLISKDMKKKGFKFLGSTTIYAHMQAVGIVNDHVVDCFRYKEVQS